MVDRFVDIEEKDLSIVALHNIWLGEVYDASAVYEQEEFYLLVDSWLFNAWEELGVASDWIDLILYVLALE